MNKLEGRTQICWSCSKAGGLCSWSKYFKPVEGWIAQKTKVKMTIKKEERYVDAYNILYCPEFEYDGMCYRCDLCPNDQKRNENYADICPEYKYNQVACANYVYRGIKHWDTLLV